MRDGAGAGSEVGMGSCPNAYGFSWRSAGSCLALSLAHSVSPVPEWFRGAKVSLLRLRKPRPGASSASQERLVCMHTLERALLQDAWFYRYWGCGVRGLPSVGFVTLGAETILVSVVGSCAQCVTEDPLGHAANACSRP